MVDLLAINTEAEEPDVETASNTTETEEQFTNCAERQLTSRLQDYLIARKPVTVDGQVIPITEIVAV